VGCELAHCDLENIVDVRRNVDADMEYKHRENIQTRANFAMDHDPDDTAYPNPHYAWFALSVLTLVYIFSFIDRQILNLLVVPIKADLKITDTQMSLLIGLTFAVFYTAFGIPLGRIADAHNRRGLIAGGFALWSAFTACCGFVGSFSQLLFMRMGVGVGEASLSPAAYSLITDYFPPRRRNIAQGVYNMGIYVGSGLALVIGGLAIAAVSRQPLWNLPLIGVVRWWQLIFIIIGGAGLLTVPLMLTVREPPRHGAAPQMNSLREVFGHLKQHRRTYLCHNIGVGLLAFSAYGSSAWLPTFFVRHHHWTGAHAGIVLGSIIAVFGSLGMVTSGWVADRWTARGHSDACMRVALLLAVTWIPTGVAMLLVPDPVWAAVLYAPSAFLAAGVYCVGPAALMQVTPARMRGQAGAIYLFTINMIGLGLGPTAVALLTDYLFHDVNQVGKSILIVTVVAHVLAGLLLWSGRSAFIRSRASVAAPALRYAA
jgi:MFS family permease